ncbi:hypothetical protein [Winogradskyella luteola]|uniref:Uncharacterized protein n=1 Tax=Winogradskyella luteola TaxID=2828330 RepID=A0A9X1JN25_9FLAO|nr:hypothetical protein [Winogradskyella luteola]MBV7268901.1 hypothetical protein [Winogradskyella luteola]
MQKPVKNAILIILVLILVPFFFFKSCVIYKPEPHECEIVTAKIDTLIAGPTFDIQFKTGMGNTYYINRGIESGLNLDSLNAKVLNKTVTLHLPKLLFGTSKHIAQLALEDQILYTEFSTN